MALVKIVLLTIILLVFLSTIAAQFGGGLYDIGFGFGGKPFKPSFGGIFKGKPGFGGLGGKPGKPGGLGGFGGLGSLYRANSPVDTGVPYYNWEPIPIYNY